MSGKQNATSAGEPADDRSPKKARTDGGDAKPEKYQGSSHSYAEDPRNDEILICLRRHPVRPHDPPADEFAHVPRKEARGPGAVAFTQRVAPPAPTDRSIGF